MLNDVPYPIKVYTQIVVNDYVPKSRDSSPVDFGSSALFCQTVVEWIQQVFEDFERSRPGPLYS